MPESVDRILGRIEGKLDAMGADIGELKAGQAAQGDQIQCLEGWKRQATGVAAVASAVISFFVAFFTSGFHIGR